MPAKYAVRLSPDDRRACAGLIASGTAPARAVAHARVLLKADAGPDGPGWTDARVAEAVEVSPSTIHRVRRAYAAGGLGAALHRKPAAGRRPRKLDGAQEARLVALACAAPPDGRERWSLRLLADRLVGLEVVDGISPETVRATLKKTTSSPG